MADAAKDGRRLGRGLSALLGEPVPAASASPVRPRGDGGLEEIDVTRIHANPDQPRRRIDEAALASLADSISTHGLVQPVVVRPDGDRFQIVAGERRWRAAQRAGLPSIPALIREPDAQQQLELALVENMVREDLSPIEVARACAVLTEDFGQSHQLVADRLGRSRPAISNLLRLLELPDDVQHLVDRGDLSEGHARAVLMADGARARRRLAERVVADGLSVRQTERAARESVRSRPSAAGSDPTPAQDDALDAFTAAFETNVRVRASRGDAVVVELTFADEDALRAAIDRLGRVPEPLPS